MSGSDERRGSSSITLGSGLGVNSASWYGRPGFATFTAWTPPELAPQLVRVLASGRADALAGRYIHAEHDDIEDLIVRADQIVADDLNAIRLRR